MQNFLLRLFLETLQRFMSKTPWFFKVIQVISIVTALVTGLPGLLDHMGLNIPEAWAGFYNQTVTWAAAVAVFVSQLTASTADKKKADIQD
jgi:hypothetical protein